MNPEDKTVRTLVNVGCGCLSHPAWINVDRVVMRPGVIACDLVKGLPFRSSSADAVYHSNVLEHFSRLDGAQLVRECVRVLKSGGVLRVTVPDLESIVAEYLAALGRVRQGDPGAADEHEWMMVELMDQMVRTEPGGAMRRWLDARPIRAERFVKSRIGRNAAIDCSGATTSSGAECNVESAGFLRKVLRVFGEPYRLRELPIRVLLGGEYPALRVGRFRIAGEVHQWMYDEVTLSCLMKNVGLKDVRRVRWSESRIEGWAGFELESDGPALRMEGVKQG